MSNKNNDIKSETFCEIADGIELISCEYDSQTNKFDCHLHNEDFREINNFIA